LADAAEVMVVVVVVAAPAEAWDCRRSRSCASVRAAGAHSGAECGSSCARLRLHTRQNALTPHISYDSDTDTQSSWACDGSG